METARRMSLTLLLVAPLVAAQEFYLSSEAEQPSVTVRQVPVDLSYPPLGLDYTDGWEVSGNSDALQRSKRSQGEDMDTAEQILFRPIFRHRQIVEERLVRKRVQEEQRRRSDQVAPPGRAPSHVFVRPAPLASTQKKYFATPLGAVYRAQQ